MKIIHCVYSMDMGGAEMVVAQLCREQRASGHEVTIFAYARKGALGTLLETEGFSLYVPGEAHPVVTIWRYARQFRRMRPDAVHCHNPGPTIHAAFGAWLAGSRSIVATRHSLVEKPYDLATELKFNLFASFCSHITGVCEITCKNLRQVPLAHRRKIMRVYNGAAPVPESVPGSPATEGLTMLFVGRLEPVKNLGMLLRAFAQAVRTHPQLRLWIIGDGSSKEPLEALAVELAIQGQVRFWGLQMEPEKFLRSADLFVMSSVSEGLPMSLLQAMSAGLPSVVTDVGGMAEVVNFAESGLRVPSNDVEAMAEALTLLADREDLREAMSRAALLAYSQEFSLKKMAASYSLLYERHNAKAAEI